MWRRGSLPSITVAAAIPTVSTINDNLSIPSEIKNMAESSNEGDEDEHASVTEYASAINFASASASSFIAEGFTDAAAAVA